MHNILKKWLIVIVFIGFYSNVIAQNKVASMRCEQLEKPLGIDVKNPRLSWKISAGHSLKQTAYQVIVGEDSLSLINEGGVIWDSGKIHSEAQLIRYDGPSLSPFTRYYWKVRTWNQNGVVSSFSPISTFEMGMMQAGHWSGSWISDSRDIHERRASYFRKEVNLEKTVASARVYIAAAGLYELYINGHRLGNQRLDPMFTRYDRRILYVTHDITDFIQEGGNAVGVLLGNGWYNHQPVTDAWYFHEAPWRNRPTFCLDLRVTYSDGSVETIYTDKTWKTGFGSLVYNNIYTGDHVDARLEEHGWNQVNFDDTDWKEPIFRSIPAPQITAQMMTPIRYVEELEPKTMRQINDTLYLYDFGKNITGITSLRVKGSEGTTLRTKHTERLDKHGMADMSNIDVYYNPKDDKEPFQVDIYTLAGTGSEESFKTLFGYKGFQYVEVTSDRPITLDKSSLTAYYMHSDVEPIGKISSSNPIIDAIWSANNNAYLGNLFGIPTDCPQREKNGWTGDANIAIETGLYSYDGITVYEKWLADHRDEQQPNGVLPAIIPTSGWGYEWANGPDWTSTIVNIPWFVYLFKGDITILEENYENMKLYVDYITSISPTGITAWGIGDWVPVKSVADPVLTSTAYSYIATYRLGEIAGLLNHGADALKYSQRAEFIKNAFNNRFLSVNESVYGSGLQTELSVPLHFGLVPDTMVKSIAKRLADRVISDGKQLDVGILGAKAILNALSDNGYVDLAYTLAAREEYPSWGWWIKNGATTFYENWDINAERDLSMNHVMFGEIGAWFYKALGGIKPDPKNAGFKNIILEPHFVDGLNHFQAFHDSPYGQIVSEWKREGNKIIYRVTVPSNAVATIHRKPGETWGKKGGVFENLRTTTLPAGQHEFTITVKR